MSDVSFIMSFKNPFLQACVCSSSALHLLLFLVYSP